MVTRSEGIRRRRPEHQRMQYGRYTIGNKLLEILMTPLLIIQVYAKHNPNRICCNIYLDLSLLCKLLWLVDIVTFSDEHLNVPAQVCFFYYLA